MCRCSHMGRSVTTVIATTTYAGSLLCKMTSKTYNVPGQSKLLWGCCRRPHGYSRLARENHWLRPVWCNWATKLRSWIHMTAQEAAHSKLSCLRNRIHKCELFVLGSRLAYLTLPKIFS